MAWIGGLREAEMTRIALALAAVSLLAGCLTTPEPVFDETNSKPLEEIPEFLAFADAWESFVAAGGSPRELIEDGGRGILIDDMIVVQEYSDYYAFGILGGRPIACLVFADNGIEAVAASHGVTVEVTTQEGATRDDAPAQVDADGPPEALVAFIRDQFANQRLACLANPRGAG